MSCAMALGVVSLAVALALPGVRRRAPWLAGAVILGAALPSSTIDPQSWSASVAWGLLAGFSGTLVVIDLENRTLPREISLTGAVLLLAFLFFAPAPPTGGVWMMALGAASMTLITAVLRAASRGALGVGDVFLAPLLGAALGWIEPWLVLVAWVATALAGGVVITGLLMAGRVTRQASVPYGPFMVFGTYAALILSGRGT